MKNVVYLILFSIVLACGPSKEEELSLEERDDQEVIFKEEIVSNLNQLTNLKLRSYFQLEEFYQDKTNPNFSKRVQPYYDILSEAINVFGSRVARVSALEKFTNNDRELFAIAVQNVSMSFLKVLDTNLSHDNRLIDSLEIIRLGDHLKTRHYGNSYDTVLINRTIETWFEGRKKLNEVSSEFDIDDIIRIKLIQSMLYERIDELIYGRIIGCYVQGRATDIIIQPFIIEDKTDSITVQFNLAYALDVFANKVIVEGLSGRGWTSNEDFYYRFKKEDVIDSVFNVRLGILNYVGNKIWFKDAKLVLPK